MDERTLFMTMTEEIFTFKYNSNSYLTTVDKVTIKLNKSYLSCNLETSLSFKFLANTSTDCKRDERRDEK